MTNTEIRKIASYIVAESMLNTSSGNYIVELDEIEAVFDITLGVDLDMYFRICNAIREDFELQVLDLNENNDEYFWNEGEFNINLGLAFCPYANDDEEEE